MDGKHIRLQCPKLSESNYCNYKGFYSIVLLAICDVKYCFISHGTGQFGSNNDSGVLSNSGILELIERNMLDLPSPSAYKSCVHNPLPYLFVGDETLPWKINGIAEVFRLPIITCAKNNRKYIRYFGN